MAAHTIAVSNPRPSFALSRLQELLTTLERLRGIDLDLLKCMGFDNLLEELTAICQAFDALNQINQEMGVTENALGLLLQLLHAAGEVPLSPQALHALIQPLCQRHATTWDKLSDLI